MSSSDTASAPPPSLPSLDGLSLRTVAPSLGVSTEEPDYLDYDIKGRGVWDRTVASTGWGYFMGTIGGGVYGLKTGYATVPNSRFKVRLNSLLNHSGRYGSRVGNAIGCVALLYSLYEGMADTADIEKYVGPSAVASPAAGAFLAGVTYKATAGPRVAAMAGTIGLGAVGATYALSRVTGTRFASSSFMFF